MSSVTVFLRSISDLMHVLLYLSLSNQPLLLGFVILLQAAVQSFFF